MAKVIQYHSSVIGADAIGNSIRMLHAKLTSHGIESYICCADAQLSKAAPGVLPASTILNAQVGRSLTEHDVLLLHYSFYDDTIERLARMPLKSILVYHNVTPGHFFAEVGIQGLANACFGSRQQLASLSTLVDAAVGDSNYNTQELGAFGYRDPTTIPVLLDTERFINSDINLDLLSSIKSSADVNILFVGRLVPNKRIERVISAAAHFSRSFPLSVKLHLVGKIWDRPYYNSLSAYAGALNVADIVQFHLHVDSLHLRTLYAAADAFVCMSDHEGFMVPIVEAFACSCPVIALDEGAVGETMGDAGLLIDAPDPELVAGLIYALKTNVDLRLRVVAAQGRRLSAFHPARAAKLWLDKIGKLSPALRRKVATGPSSDAEVPNR